MLLFLTRLACLSFSMLERRWLEVRAGDGERFSAKFSLLSLKRAGDMALSRPDQKTRGDEVGLLSVNEGGDEFSVYGLASRETIIFC